MYVWQSEYISEYVLAYIQSDLFFIYFYYSNHSYCFKKVETLFSSTTVFYNLNLLSGGKPFVRPSWAAKGILTLNDKRRKSLDFQELIKRFNISQNTLFLYFKLRAALKAHKVPWGTDLQTHPVVKWINNAPNKGTVSYFYFCFSTHTADIFPKARAWLAEFIPINRNIEWETFWDNTFHASTTPNHQFIHFEIIHRAYLTMRTRHIMGLSPHPYSNFCGPGCLGTLMHMLWECLDVQDFWDMVLDVLHKVTGIHFPKDPVLLLLNDNSQFPLNKKDCTFWLAASTAANKLLVQ